MEARDQTRKLMVIRWIHFHCATTGPTPALFFLKIYTLENFRGFKFCVISVTKWLDIFVLIILLSYKETIQHLEAIKTY